MRSWWRNNITGDYGATGQGAKQTGFLEGLVFSALISNSITFGLAGSALAIGAITAFVGIGLSLGLSYLANSLMQPATSSARPEDVQQSSKQPTQPRARHYGRVKVGGAWVFAEAYAGSFHKVLAIGQGPIDGVEEFWIDDNQVTLDSAGNVQTDIGLDGGAPPRIDWRLGSTPESPYTALNSIFPGWDLDHRGDGVASLYVLQSPVPQGSYLAAYPNGINTSYRTVIRGSRIENPVSGSVAWDDNAASIIRDYMMHSDGMRLPATVFNTPLAQAGWREAYSRCAGGVTLATGGTEPRYRIWGTYFLNERPADVIGRMLECCDGRLKPTPDGGLTLDIGRWAEPSVIIDETCITGFTDLSRGRDIMSSANTIRATFLDPGSDYQSADADPWTDDDDVAVRGEITIDKRYDMAPSHSQCRRLMKLAAYRSNPTWVGVFNCNLGAMAAFDERFVRIRYPLFGIDAVFEVQDFNFNIGSGDVVVGVTLTVQSLPEAAYQWDAAQEEGSAPVSDETESVGAPRPAAPLITLITGPIARLSFSPVPSSIYRHQARYKKVADASWTMIEEIDIGATTVDTDTLDGSTAYEFQIRLISTALGIPGAWSASTLATTS